MWSVRVVHVYVCGLCVHIYHVWRWAQSSVPEKQAWKDMSEGANDPTLLSISTLQSGPFLTLPLLSWAPYTGLSMSYLGHVPQLFAWPSPCRCSVISRGEVHDHPQGTTPLLSSASLLFPFSALFSFPHASISSQTGLSILWEP